MKEQTEMLGTTQEADPLREMLMEWGQGHLCGPSGPLKSQKIPSFPSQLEWKIGLAWANTRGSLNSPS